MTRPSSSRNMPRETRRDSCGSVIMPGAASESLLSSLRLRKAPLFRLLRRSLELVRDVPLMCWTSIMGLETQFGIRR